MPHATFAGVVSLASFSACLLTLGCATAPQAAAPMPAPVPTSVAKASSAVTMSFELPPGAEVHDISKLDVMPRPTRQARPRFPADLRKAGISGEAVTDFFVGPDGRVYDAKSIRATHPALGAAAVEAVSQWEFTPGRKDGRVVWTHMQVPIVFSINER